MDFKFDELAMLSEQFAVDKSTAIQTESGNVFAVVLYEMYSTSEKCEYNVLFLVVVYSSDRKIVSIKCLPRKEDALDEYKEQIDELI